LADIPDIDIVGIQECINMYSKLSHDRDVLLERIKTIDKAISDASADVSSGNEEQMRESMSRMNSLIAERNKLESDYSKIENMMQRIAGLLNEQKQLLGQAIGIANEKIAQREGAISGFQSLSNNKYGGGALAQVGPMQAQIAELSSKLAQFTSLDGEIASVLRR
jgi:chromosome segregation ATPase